jgi:hypothetical protein
VYSKITISPESFPTLKAAGSSLLLLLWLAMHASQDGLVCAGVPVPLQTLAEELGCSRSALKASIARLKKTGLLQAASTKHGLILCVKVAGLVTQPENKPIIISEPDRKPTGPASEQPIPSQVSSPLITTGQPTGQKTSPPPNRLSLLVAAYKQFCADHGIVPHLSRHERESLFFFLQRHPRLRSGELQRAFAAFCRMTDPENVNLSGFIQESEQELAAGLSEASLNENQEGGIHE